MSVLNVQLPDELHDELREFSKESGMPQAEIVRRALLIWLADREER